MNNSYPFYTKDQFNMVTDDEVFDYLVDLYPNSSDESIKKYLSHQSFGAAGRIDIKIKILDSNLK